MNTGRSALWLIKPPGSTRQSGLFSLIWLCANFGHQYMLSCFLAMLARKKKNPLDQNYLRTMINKASTIICAKGDKKLSAMTCLIQANVEVTCFGRHTFFVIADFIGIAPACCSIDSIRNYCNFIFWVWDKSEGYHLGRKYFESSLSFSHCLALVHVLPLTRLLLQAISLL